MTLLGFVICLALFAACWVPREPNKALFWGALIGAGASLIGGALNRKSQKQANAANSPEGQVLAYERAGLNPVPFMLNSGYIPQQSTSIGDSFAAAGGQLGRALEMNHEQDLRETQMELENEKLRKQIDILANPADPSHMDIYGGILPLPRLGGSNARKSNSNAGRTGGNSGATGPNVTEVIPQDYTVLRAQGAEASSVLTNPGLVDVVSEHYGDEVADYEGFLNYAKDWWHGSVLKEDYFPGFGWESQIVRPRSRPNSIGEGRPKPTRKQRIEFMRDNYPSPFDF